MTKTQLKKTYEEEIKRIVTSLKGYNPEKIILFGSIARDDFDKDSDIDLLIIKDDRKKRTERICEIYRLIRSPKRTIAVEPLVLTPKEVKKAVSEGSFLLEDILKEGKVLYEKS